MKLRELLESKLEKNKDPAKLLPVFGDQRKFINFIGTENKDFFAEPEHRQDHLDMVKEIRKSGGKKVSMFYGVASYDPEKKKFVTTTKDKQKIKRAKPKMGLAC